MVPKIIPGVELIITEDDGHAEDAPLPGSLENELPILPGHGQAVAEILDASIGHLRAALAWDHALKDRPTDLGHADHGVARD